MTYRQAENYIHSFTRFGSQLGLDRMKKLLSLLGNPQDSLRFIHIAGTNGKGSTAKMAASILEEAGYTVGMFTSPFVVEFRERYQINGKMIGKADFVKLVNFIQPAVQKLADDGSMVTEFEAVTAIGFLYFKQMHCDIVALEVGLGGRFDSTNVINTPECAVITSISLDHMKILGDTIEKIAFEKAGIIKDNTDVITYPLQEPDAIGVFFEKCAETGSRLIQPNANAVHIIKSGVPGSKFGYGGNTYQIKMAGIHQVYNAVAVIESMKILQMKGFKISDAAIQKGLKKAAIPARFEILNRKPLIILDGAHNRQAVTSLSNTIDQLGPITKIAIMGMMADKDYKSAVESIGRHCQAIFTVPVKGNPRAIDAAKLADTAKEFCSRAEAADNYEYAIEKAVNLAGENGAIIICGSFYMATDMRKVVKQMKMTGFYNNRAE